MPDYSGYDTPPGYKTMPSVRCMLFDHYWGDPPKVPEYETHRPYEKWQTCQRNSCGVFRRIKLDADGKWWELKPKRLHPNMFNPWKPYKDRSK